MQLTVYGPLRGVTGEKTVEVAFDGGTVADALDRFLDAYPRAARHLRDDGELRASVRILRDGERADLDDECPPDATLSVFPAMRGGAPAGRGWSGGRQSPRSWGARARGPGT